MLWFRDAASDFPALQGAIRHLHCRTMRVTALQGKVGQRVGQIVEGVTRHDHARALGQAHFVRLHATGA